jgi:hypothetical protein
VTPLRERLGRLDGETVQEVAARVLALLAPAFRELSRPGADGHHLESEDVPLRRDVVGQAEVRRVGAPRKRESPSLRPVLVEDDDVVPLGAAGEVASQDPGLEPALAHRLPLELLEERLELLAQELLAVDLPAANPPRQREQGLPIEERKDLREVHGLDLPRAPPGRLRQVRRRIHGPGGRRRRRRLGAARGGRQPAPRGLEVLGDGLGPPLVVEHALQGLEPLEGVAAVEDAARVRLVLAAGEERPTPERGVDRGAADEHGEIATRPVELLHDDRHLLRRADEQRRQAHRVGLHLVDLLEDRAHRDLLAQVVHDVAVVLEDGPDEVLPDVVDVAEDGGEHDGALARALGPVEEPLHVRHGALHHLGRLQHEGQDELAASEPVPHVAHRLEQHRVEDVDG